MTRNETIEVFKLLKQMKPNYFETLSQEKKLDLVDEWTDRLSMFNFDLVKEASKEYVFQHNRIPYPREVIEYLGANRETIDQRVNPWYKRFPQSEKIRYTDADVRGLTLDEWRLLPREMAVRMEYYIDPSDEIRNALLKEALEIQEKTRIRR